MKPLKVSELIALLNELEDDCHIMIYDSSGDWIVPAGFSYGGMSTDEGFVDTVSFSDL